MGSENYISKIIVKNENFSVKIEGRGWKIGKKKWNFFLENKENLSRTFSFSYIYIQKLTKKKNLKNFPSNVPFTFIALCNLFMWKNKVQKSINNEFSIKKLHFSPTVATKSIETINFYHKIANKI